MPLLNFMLPLEKLIDQRLLPFCRGIGAAAKRQRMNAYLVGGSVRDLFLGHHSPDLDFMLEGDAISFLAWLRERWPLLLPDCPHPDRIVPYRRYRTVKIFFDKPLAPGIDRVDFASARRETYPTPGGRPVVEPGTLAEDLARRDFSVNAMALSLAPDAFSGCHDDFGGEEDIRARRIRILHQQSFVDDPARLIRAVRFLVRLGFELEETTARLFQQALEEKLLAAVPRFRVFDEFRKALSEPDSAAVLAQLEAAGLLLQIHPRLSLRALQEARSAGRRQESWRDTLGVLLSHCSAAERESALKSFELPQADIAALMEEWRCI